MRTSMTLQYDFEKSQILALQTVGIAGDDITYGILNLYVLIINFK